MLDLIAAAARATAGIMISVLPSLFIGLFLAGLFARRGLFRGGGGRLLPAVARFTGLPPACALSVLLAVGDRTAGMAAVALARRQTGLSDREVIAANLVAKAPSVLQFFIFSFIPIMAALYPAAVAVRFLAVYFAAFLAMSLLGVGYARLIGRGGTAPLPAATGAGSAMPWPAAAREALAGVWRPLGGMVGWMAAMSFAALLFIKTGLFQELAGQLPRLGGGSLDAGTLSLAATGLVSMIGGVAAVGAALRDGMIQAPAVVPLLLAVSILHNVYDLFASSMPRAVGVFGRRLGLKVALAGFAVTQAVMAAVLIMAIYAGR